jgi:hypothetical protein
MTYHYSVIRFSPDPARGEFVNLGIIVGDDESGDWELQLISNLRRAKAFDARGSLSAALSFVDSLQERIQALDILQTGSIEPISISFLDQLSMEMRNVVQVSSPAPVTAQTSSEALDVLFPELVVDPTSKQFRFEKKHRAITSTRDSYKKHNVPDTAVNRRTLVRTGPFEHTFDFTVNNGHVVQLVQCWSFQLPNQTELAEEIKAWAWVAHELRKIGGEALIGGTYIQIPRGDGMDIASVYVAAIPDVPSPAFDEAQAAFEETETTAVPAERADLVGERAAALLAAS